MNELTLTQEFLLCVLDEKGNYPAFSTELPVCTVASGLLELEMIGCIEIDNKKVIVKQPLPTEKLFLQSLYDYLTNGKDKKLETIAGDYAFSGKRLTALLTDACGTLVETNDVTKQMGGLFGKKILYVPNATSIDRIIQRIRAEILEDGELTDEVMVLAILLEKCNYLKRYFSKYEAKQLKQRLKQLKESESNQVVKQMIDYITTMIVIIAAS